MELALVSRGPSWSSSPAGQMAYLFTAVFPGSWEEVGEQALETFEAVLGNALEAMAAAVETVLEMVGMQPCLLPHHNRRPEHYAGLVIVLLDLGWGRPCCVRTEDNESIVI